MVQDNRDEGKLGKMNIEMFVGNNPSRHLVINSSSII